MRKLIDLDDEVIAGIRLINVESGLATKLWIEKLITDTVRRELGASVERSVVGAVKCTPPVPSLVKTLKTEKPAEKGRFNIWGAIEEVRGE